MRARMLAPAMAVLVPAVTSGEPFLHVPALVTAQRAPGTRAPGLELLAPGAPRWALTGEMGPSGSGITGRAAGLAVGPLALGTSGWGTSFYHEHRGTIACRWGGSDRRLGGIVDLRTVTIEGRRARFAGGAGAHLAGEDHGIEWEIATGPRRLVGHRLHLGGWRIALSVPGAHGQLAAAFETVAGTAHVLVHAGFTGRGAWIDVGLRPNTGAISVTVGALGPTAVHAGVAIDAALGARALAGVSGRAR